MRKNSTAPNACDCHDVECMGCMIKELFNSKHAVGLESLIDITKRYFWILNFTCKMLFLCLLFYSFWDDFYFVSVFIFKNYQITINLNIEKWCVIYMHMCHLVAHHSVCLPAILAPNMLGVGMQKVAGDIYSQNLIMNILSYVVISIKL